MLYPSGVDTVTNTALTHYRVLACRAASIIFKLSREMPFDDVLIKAKWYSLFNMYKNRLLGKLVYMVYNDLEPPSMHHIIVEADNKCGLSKCFKSWYHVTFFHRLYKALYCQ